MKRIVATLLALTFLLQACLPLAATQVDTSREDQLLKTALEYIEKNRKGSAEIRLIDNITGRPVSGAEVSYQQTSHDFILTSRPWTYTENATRPMNALGLEFRDIYALWGQSEPQRGVYDFGDLDGRIALIERDYPNARIWVWIEGIVPRDREDYAPRFDPPAWSDWAEITKNPNAFERYKTDVYRYVFNLVTHYKSKIKAWMTQNEINYLTKFTLYRNQTIPDAKVGTLSQAVELDRVTARAIRDGNPDALIVLGTSTPQGKSTEKYVDPIDFAKTCLKSGVEFDALGFHIYPWNGWSPADYYDYLQKAQKVGKKIFPHEVGYPSATSSMVSDSSDWKWHDFSEDAQAKWLNYTFTFSLGTKDVIGFGYYWTQDGLSGSLYAAGGWGLVRGDGSPKKSYLLYKEMVRRYTASGKGTADAAGAFAFRGLGGSYSLKVEADGYLMQTVSLQVVEGQNNTHSILLTRHPVSSITTVDTSGTETLHEPGQLPSPDSTVYAISIVVIVVFAGAVVIHLRRKKTF